MADIALEIVFDDGHTRSITFNPNKIKLKTLAQLETAQKTNAWADLFPVIGGMLKLTTAEVEDLTIDQFREITSAIQAATAVPNASAPSTAES